MLLHPWPAAVALAVAALALPQASGLAGRPLIFASYANGIPDGASATAAMDAVLVLTVGEN